MIDPNKINDVTSDFAKEFLLNYIGKGFGLMNKSEVEVLLYHLLVKHQLLSGKCFNDSLELEVSEAKVRKLLYESQLKYGEHDIDRRELDFRTRVAKCLQHAYFDKDNKHIKFAVEDQYLRTYLYAKLRDNAMHADTSFNRDIVSVSEKAFAVLIKLLIPNNQIPNFYNQLKDNFQIDATGIEGEDKKAELLTQYVFKTIEIANGVKTGIELLIDILPFFA